MKTKIITILMMTMLVPVCQVQAIDVDFYSDATIGNGDVYDWVYVYDTPPDYTVVDLYDGSVFVFVTYDSSTVNIYGGEISIDPQSYNSSTVNIYGGSLICQSIIVWDSATAQDPEPEIIYYDYIDDDGVLKGGLPSFGSQKTN